MSVKKVITWLVVVILILGTIFAGGLFNFIDIIIVRPIVNILFEIYNLVGDFGAAIIIFTVIVKFAMWPLMGKQIKQTQLLNRLQPELQKIHKKANGNRQIESMETMALYRKYKVNPFSSLILLCIQLPIFIAVYSAIRVIAVPQINDNLTNRAYEIVAYEGSEIKSIEEKQMSYLSDLQNDEISAEEKTAYDFHPQLFGVINLDVRASDVFTGKFSWSAFFILMCAIIAAGIQYYIANSSVAKSQKGKKKSFREIMKEAESGKEIDQSEITAISTRQMNKLMPLMMFFIMFSLHGALAFYYLLSNLINLFQQKVIRRRIEKKLDSGGIDLENIKEAEIVENKKTGTKITLKSSDEKKESNSKNKNLNSSSQKKTSKNSSSSKKASVSKSEEKSSNKRRKT